MTAAPSIGIPELAGLASYAGAARIGFAVDENVRRLLLDAPFGPRAVLGVDPGVRTGSKLAAVDAKGGL